MQWRALRRSISWLSTGSKRKGQNGGKTIRMGSLPNLPPTTMVRSTCSSGNAISQGQNKPFGKEVRTILPWTSAATTPSGIPVLTQTAQVRIQTSAAPSQHIPLGYSVSVHPQRRGRLETSHHSSTATSGNSEVIS